VRKYHDVAQRQAGFIIYFQARNLPRANQASQQTAATAHSWSRLLFAVAGLDVLQRRKRRGIGLEDWPSPPSVHFFDVLRGSVPFLNKAKASRGRNIVDYRTVLNMFPIPEISVLGGQSPTPTQRWRTSRGFRVHDYFGAGRHSTVHTVVCRFSPAGNSIWLPVKLRSRNTV